MKCEFHGSNCKCARSIVISGNSTYSVIGQYELEAGSRTLASSLVKLVITPDFASALTSCALPQHTGEYEYRNQNRRL